MGVTESQTLQELSQGRDPNIYAVMRPRLTPEIEVRLHSRDELLSSIVVCMTLPVPFLSLIGLVPFSLHLHVAYLRTKASLSMVELASP
jgi:hypothetical protein